LCAGSKSGGGLGGLLKKAVLLAGLVAGGVFVKKKLDARK
jgi:hypothetical protein